MNPLYASALQALQNESAQVRLAGQNLVNAAATGYKREVAGPGFAQALGAAAPTPGVAATDFRAGALRQTGDPAHLALEGPGFFVLRRGDSVLYTRAGAFTREAGGRLVDAGGHALQAGGGDLVLRGSDWRVERDGTVLDDGQAVGRLSIVDFPERGGLQRVGAAAFAGQGAERVATPSVRQGHLEASNVDASQEMVRLMESLKRFEFGQRIVHAQDDLMEKALRRLSEG